MRHLDRLCVGIDRLSAAGRYLAAGIALILVACTLFEIVMRYVFSAPTIWAFDVAYMLNGSVFFLAIAGALQSGAHVRIDFLSAFFPKRVWKAIDAAFFLGPAAIAIGMIMFAGMSRTIRAISTGEVEPISPWAPVMWPFLLALTVGLTLLFLQCIAQGLRSLRSVFTP